MAATGEVMVKVRVDLSEVELALERVGALRRYLYEIGEADRLAEEFEVALGKIRERFV